MLVKPSVVQSGHASPWVSEKLQVRQKGGDIQGNTVAQRSQTTKPSFPQPRR
ncbi:hypothetical protein ACFLTW_02240 [Chloroflexota bacterium]